MNELTTYEGLLARNPLVSQIISEQTAEVVFENSKSTVKSLGKIWLANLRKNLKLLDSHSMVVDSFLGFGKDKAIISVGAGPSFNINKHVLKQVYDYNIKFPLEDQPFIIIASNKMFKPLLKLGIRPHFVMLTDAGDVLYEQLCSGIAKKSKNHLLITGFHTSPKILKRWQEMGNHLLFYLIGEDEEKDLFTEKTGKDSERHHISQGGNVLNTLWVIANRFFECSVYITVGNDLSFAYSEDRSEREESFYAVGDYRTNILNKRDEAKDKFGWMGVNKIYKSAFSDQMMMDFAIKGVSRQLWIYKTWMEVQATIWSEKHRFFIYNASESGVLGVLAKDYSRKAIMSKDNWFLIDELLPKRWLTTTLDEACTQFLKAKLWQKEKDAGSVIDSQEMTGIVKPIGQQQHSLMF